MKKIIPFKKDVIFKTKLGEITSISLEHNLKIIDGTIEGNFIVDGEYKEDLESLSSEPFNLKLPFKNIIDEKYDTSNAIVDIDDFYYEIMDNNVLSVSIDVLVDKLEEKPIIRQDTVIENKEIEENKKEEIRTESSEIKDKITTIFNTNNNEDSYVTYNVCIIREGDTLETIMDKYKIEPTNHLVDILYEAIIFHGEKKED